MTHYLEIDPSFGEPTLRLVCAAGEGADCRKRHTDPQRESWDADDPDLVDTSTCWAVEWVEAAGWQEAVRCEPDAAFARIPVDIAYSEGVTITPAGPSGPLCVEDFEQALFDLPDLSQETVEAAAIRLLDMVRRRATFVDDVVAEIERRLGERNAEDARRFALLHIEAYRAGRANPRRCAPTREQLADRIPLGFTDRDPYRNTFEAADAIAALYAAQPTVRDVMADGFEEGFVECCNQYGYPAPDAVPNPYREEAGRG